MLPIGFLRDKAQPIPKPRPRPIPRTRRQTEGNRTTVTESTDESEDESEDEVTVGYVLKRRVDSGTRPTEESADDSVHGDQTFPDGDAHGRRDSTGSASDDNTGDTVDQDDEPVPVVEVSPVPLRRSTRERKQPAWLTSGQYVNMSAVGSPVSQELQAVPPADWLQKAEYISSIAKTPMFTGLEKDAAHAILRLVSHQESK